jgi:hypothetical protein
MFWTRAGRAPLVIMSLACLTAAIWGGLLRLAVKIPPPGQNANWISLHGPLMVCGFLGTLIALERAVGLRRWWAYVPPFFTGVGALAVVCGVTQSPPLYAITVGSALFFLVTLRVVAMQRGLFTSVMSGGAAMWVVGNILWLVLVLSRKTVSEDDFSITAHSFAWVVPWWIGFLALTIVGERIDLSRFQKPSPWSHPLLYAALALYVGGVITGAFRQTLGERLWGAGMLALACWLGWFDLAKRTVKQPGLPQFMAACLLVGFFWMGLAGFLVLLHAPLQPGQFTYDAALHSFFLSFVFSMIFGHAPVIFPAVLGIPISFRPWFYTHVALLHAALALRVGGDLAGNFAARQWGAIFAGIAVALFVANTVGAAVLSSRPRTKK